MSQHASAPDLPVIFAASCLGAPDRRCDAGPRRLAEMLANSALPGLRCLPVIEPESEDGLGVLAAFLAGLADSVAAHLQQRMLVISGDHSCAIGTWQGAARQIDPMGLIWIDAHMDAHTPESSPRGHWHGMPVACLLGRGDPSLVRAGAAIRPENLCLLGVRSYEAPEAKLLQELGVRVMSINEVRRMGFAAAMAEARAIAAQGTAGYGLSLDLDGLDPVDAPAVGSPVVGGITATEFMQSLALLYQDPDFRVLEVAEFNPVHDIEQRTLSLLMQMVTLMSGGDDESQY